MRKGSLFVAISIINFSLLCSSFAEDLVSYRVSTSCTVDWDIAVNGITIVRHRPTGFGRCLYSGSVNRAVTNGWNTVSLLKINKETHTLKSEPCISLEIDYIHNYTGQRTFDITTPVVQYRGSDTTNLLFQIIGPISEITGGTVYDSGRGLFTESAFFYIGLALYFLFVNIYGFIMVAKDRQAARKRLARISSARFVWNAIFGGGIGTLLSVIIRKHDMDKTISIVVIPAVIIIQFGLFAFALSPAGQQFIGRISPRIPVMHSGRAFDKSSNFFKSLKRTDPIL